jgi:hypothetical protein
MEIHGPDIASPCIFSTPAGLPAGSYLAKTIAAVNRPALTRLERHGSFLAAFGANRREHLATAPRAIAVAITLCFPCLTAFGAAFGLVGIASLLELLLFLGSESKGITAIGTSEVFVFESHRMTSSLNHLVRARAIQYLM